MTTRRTTRHGALGWRPDLPDHRDLIFEIDETTPPLASVDLEAEMPPVYDQGQLGSCTANGTAAVLDYARHKAGLPFMSPSRLFIYYGERVIEGTVSSDSGAEIRDGIKVLASEGAPPESEWPYVISKFARKPPAKAYKDAVKHEALVYKRVPQTQQAIESVLSQGIPIVFGFTVYESFESAEVARTGVVPMPARGESVLGGHCVDMIGYNSTDFPGRPKMRNSWGSGWAVRGHFSLSWQYLLSSHLCSDLWAISSVKG